MADHTARRLRIRTRCSSVAEFVLRYAVKTDEESIRLELNRASTSGPRPFAIFLDNDTPVMWGIADLDVHDPDSARLRFVQLGDEAAVVHEQLLAERFSNEPTSCWSRFPLPAPPVTRIARLDEVTRPPHEVQAEMEPTRRSMTSKFLRAGLIVALALFASSWMTSDVSGSEGGATEDPVETTAKGDVATALPVVTPMLQMHDHPQPRDLVDTERQTKRRDVRRRR